MSRDLAPWTDAPTPAIIAARGPKAEQAFWTFFAARIRNPNTRSAYLQAARLFVAFCEERGLQDLGQVQPFHVAAWVEARCQERAPATVKQQLAAVRNLCDWLVIQQVLPHNPASPVKPPKESMKVGKTPVLSAEEARQLLGSIPTHRLAGARDRALIATMLFTFARISAALGLRLDDIEQRRGRLWLHYREKGGKIQVMPCNHRLEEILRDYLELRGTGSPAVTRSPAGEGRPDSQGPLFPAVDRVTGFYADRPLTRRDALAGVKRRAKAAGIDPRRICNHSFRGTGITAYLQAPGTRREIAQMMAGHSDPRSTQLYDRRDEEISLAEVERIQF